MKRYTAIFLTGAILLMAPTVYGAGGEHASHGNHQMQKVEEYNKPMQDGELNSLTEIPGSGKAREANFDGRYRMEPTGTSSLTRTLCAQASRGLIHIDNETWKLCGGKIEGASKGPGFYPAVHPWNEVGTGKTHSMGGN